MNPLEDVTLKKFITSLLPLGTLDWLARNHQYALLRFREPIAKAFHCNFYNELKFHKTHWMGVQLLKCPFDLWVYQEILHEHQPDLVIETGTFQGGSAFYMSNIMDLIGKGRIVTIDIDEKPNRPQHPRITYITASSTAPETIEKVKGIIQPGEKVMVILDSYHGRDHVLREMELYHGFVSGGCYMIVEDTNVNNHPVEPSFGPGPMEAVDLFMGKNRQFVIDAECEKYDVSMNPRGYLKKVA